MDAKNPAVFSALNHPLRRAILRIFAKRSKQEPISPKDVADQLGLILSNVSYHIRFLMEAGALTLVNTEQVRGSVRHLYEAGASLAERWVRDLLDLTEEQDVEAIEELRQGADKGPQSR